MLMLSTTTNGQGMPRSMNTWKPRHSPLPLPPLLQTGTCLTRTGEVLASLVYNCACPTISLKNKALLFFFFFIFSGQWSNGDKVQENMKGDTSVPQNDGKNHYLFLWISSLLKIALQLTEVCYPMKQNI